MFYVVDILTEQYAWQHILTTVLSLRPQALPTWNSFTFAGSPLLADPEFQVYYPPSTLFRLLSFPMAYGIYFVLHLVVATLGTHSLLTAIGVSQRSALLGAISFGLGSQTFATGMNAQICAARSWLPWIAFASWRSSRLTLSSASMMHALLFVWLLLAGHPQHLLYGFALSFIVAASGGAGFGQALRFELTACVALASAGACLLLPGMAYAFLESARGDGLSPAAYRLNAMAVTDLAAYINPYSRTVHLMDGSFVASSWSKWHFVGTFTSLLAFIGAFGQTDFPQVQKVSRRLIVCGLIFGLGPLLPVLGDVMRVLPPFSFFRHAALWMVLVDLGLVLLAAVGMDALFCRGHIRVKGNRNSRILLGSFLLLALLVALGIALNRIALHRAWTTLWWWGTHPGGWFRTLGFSCVLVLLGLIASTLGSLRRGCAAVLFISTYAELVLVCLPSQPRVPSSLCMKTMEDEGVVRRLQAQDTATCTSRTILWPPNSTPGYPCSISVSGRTLRDAMSSFRTSMQPNLPALFGIKMADGDNPLVPRSVHDKLRQLSLYKSPLSSSARSILDELGVEVLISRVDLNLPGSIALNPATFAFRRHALLPSLKLRPDGCGAILQAATTLPGFYQVALTVSVPGAMIVDETFLPGWRYTIGRERSTAAVQYGTRVSVPLTVGAFVATVEYVPFTVHVGLFVSIATLFMMLVLPVRTTYLRMS